MHKLKQIKLKHAQLTPSVQKQIYPAIRGPAAGQGIQAA